MIAWNQVPQYDCVLVGGGLQSGLIALAIKHFRPDTRVLMIECGSHIAGNHTWSFHPGDVPDTCHAWIETLVVIDCRGPSKKNTYVGCGYQKFVGFELELGDDWLHDHPIVMESTEDQSDGFRFLYTLPFSRRRVLVEDTRFSDSPDLDREACFEVVREYLG